ncbi:MULTISPECIES: hypothetical protein [unclassified Microcoleus]|uniref:hypothetical protein n=1 Tax=unclassified Microcoleus TaxID=2642155 RepID=UPI0025F2F187|nr:MULTISPECIES: hypothetical protein [unclassified Microcoleus]
MATIQLEWRITCSKLAVAPAASGTPSGDRLKNQQLVLYFQAIHQTVTAETGKNSLQLISGCTIIPHLFRKLLTDEFGSNDRNFQQIDWQIRF